MKNLKIYFTSDLHGYIYPTDYRNNDQKNMGLLNIINSYKKDENTLIIDGGDTIQGSPFTTYISKEKYDMHPVAKVMNIGGYDYITLGNHDFNYGYEYLKNYVDSFNGKCLCTNITDKLGEIDLLPSDIKVLENGLKVGLIGFTTDFITVWERAENLENFIVQDTYSSIIKEYEKLKNETDILIGIYHGGFENDLTTNKVLSTTKENIANKICAELEFDILLTAHQHMNLSGQYVNDTYIVQTSQNGNKFIEINVDFDDTKNKIAAISSSLNTPDDNPNKEAYNLLYPIEEKVQQWLDIPVGFLNKPLLPTKHLEMAINGCPLIDFINQVQLDVSGAQVSCASVANSVKGFNKEVTVRDVVSTYIYPNTLVVLEVTGSILKQALEKSASYFHKNKNGHIEISKNFLHPKVQHYNYDYFSGIYYTFDLNNNIGSRVTSLVFNGKPVKEDDKLTLVMNNYRASGVAGYDFYKDCPVVKEIQIEMAEIIINYFEKHKNVTVDSTKYLTLIK